MSLKAYLRAIKKRLVSCRHGIWSGVGAKDAEDSVAICRKWQRSYLDRDSYWCYLLL